MTHDPKLTEAIELLHAARQVIQTWEVCEPGKIHAFLANSEEFLAEACGVKPRYNGE